MSDMTEINATLTNSMTEVNPIFGGSASAATKPEGFVLGGKYRILDRLDIITGEADLFLCECGGAEYVAKIYRRDISIKSDVIEKLGEINSSRVAKIIDTGTVSGKVYEILHYYRKGSLQGKTFDLERLKRFIIPDIAEGLKILHDKGIIHKDLKPSNIMICDDGQGVAIIDFGISSLKSGGSTIVVTDTGMTPEYSAPETFKGLFLAESDYYSLGISVYELFCGTTPYKNMPDDEIEKYISVQKLPKPAAMPGELYELVCALTYYDITNRRDKENPNRRWTYDEVINWCNGVKQQIPGSGVKSAQMPPYPFMGEKYYDVPKLVAALGENWAEGKQQLVRGFLSGFFKTFDPEIAGLCMDAENEIAEHYEIWDVIFFKLLYTLHKGLKEFYFNGRHFKGLRELGEYMLEKLAVNDTSDYSYYKDILSDGILSMYAGFTGAPEKSKASLLSIEKAYRQGGGKQKEVIFYVSAYLLSGKRTLDIEGRTFGTVEELAAHIKVLMNRSYEELEQFCGYLINDEFELIPEFEGWLTVLGKQDAIKNWRVTV